MLLTFVTEIVEEQVTDLTKSWKTGEVFLKLTESLISRYEDKDLNEIRAELQMGEWEQLSVLERLQKVFTVAEERLQVQF